MTVPSKADADALVKLFHGQTFHGKQLCVQLAYTHNDETNGSQSSSSSKVPLLFLLYELLMDNGRQIRVHCG